MLLIAMQVSVVAAGDGGFHVALDGRRTKTPQGVCRLQMRAPRVYLCACTHACLSPTATVCACVYQPSYACTLTSPRQCGGDSQRGAGACGGGRVGCAEDTHPAQRHASHLALQHRPGPTRQVRGSGLLLGCLPASSWCFRVCWLNCPSSPLHPPSIALLILVQRACGPDGGAPAAVSAHRHCVCAHGRA